MEVKIDIPDKVYNEIVEMCDFNSISVEDFSFQCVMDSFNLMKYADLNEKLNNTKITVEEKPFPEELKKELDKIKEIKEKNDSTVEKKKVGRPRKKKSEEDSALIEDKKTEQSVIRKEDIVNTTDNSAKKIKRILKVK